MAEVARAGIQRPSLLAVTKIDESDEWSVARLAARFPGLQVVPTSILDPASLERLKQAAWALTGLMRIWPSQAGRPAAEPMALARGATVLDAAQAIHSELATRFNGARLWGPSARYPGQRVGREHVLHDGDSIEIITR
jgi:ribosome-interacting GTPase 1